MNIVKSTGVHHVSELEKRLSFFADLKKCNELNISLSPPSIPIRLNINKIF